MPYEQPHNLFYEISLTLIPGIGDVLAKTLISYCGSAKAVFEQKKSQLMHIPGIGEKTASEIKRFDQFRTAEKEIGYMEKHNVNPLFYTHPGYPSRLKQIDDAPILLYSLGEADLNNRKIVGVVGTRKASDYGKQCVEELIQGLTETGCLIVSGLAYGIDIHAHRDALKTGLPTVGVLAHGLDRIYPAQHQNTARKMLETNGGLLTEHISYSNPDRENFPKRNRIVAGMCDVLVVVETAERGGAMITAELANGYNKDVAAYPGRATDEYSKGCNKLIQTNKAALVTKAEDLLNLMGWLAKPKVTKQQLLPLDLSEDERLIVAILQQSSRIHIDDLSANLGQESGSLSLQLLEMEFKGLIRSLPGKRYELV